MQLMYIHTCSKCFSQIITRDKKHGIKSKRESFGNAAQQQKENGLLFELLQFLVIVFLVPFRLGTLNKEQGQPQSKI